MATEVNLFPDQGADYQHVFLYRNRATGQPINLAGATVECQIRPFPQSDDILLDADNAAKGNLEITDEANGEITLTIPGATTATWRNDLSVYDIKSVIGGKPDRIAEGTVYLNKATTRS